jgi:hypothetical protein
MSDLMPLDARIEGRTAVLGPPCHEYLNHYNQNPRVFTWTASAESILAKVAKCKEALDALH